MTFVVVVLKTCEVLSGFCWKNFCKFWRSFDSKFELGKLLALAERLEAAIPKSQITLFFFTISQDCS